MGENKNTPSSARELLDNQPKQADETLFEVEQNITGLSSEKIITANEKIISEKATETNGLKTNNTSETADIKKITWMYIIMHILSAENGFIISRSLMLFLAVFCGFLAENEREHFIENKREKQFIESRTNDCNWTLRGMDIVSNSAKSRVQNIDSALMVLPTQPIIRYHCMLTNI